MPFASYQWRAGEGYLPPSDSVPVPVTTSPMFGYYAQPPTYGGFAYPIVYGPGQPVLAAQPPAATPVLAAVPPPPPPAAKAPERAPEEKPKFKNYYKSTCKCSGGSGKDTKCSCHSRYVRYTYSKEPAKEPAKKTKEIEAKLKAGKKEYTGKVTVQRFVENMPPPPPPTATAFTWKSSSTIAPSSSASHATRSSKSSSSSSSSSKKLPPPAPPSSAPSLSAYAAPTLRPGVNYMFPPKTSHTMLHIMNSGSPIWEEKYQSKEMKFKQFKVSTEFKVKNVVERVMRKEGEACKGWAVTEVVELGDGKWVKGTTIEYDSDKAGGTLESMGWNAKRGDKLPPVWLVVHKVKKDK